MRRGPDDRANVGLCSLVIRAGHRQQIAVSASNVDGARSPRKNLVPFDLIARVGVQGDFEITATTEILHADRPRDGFGVGTSLFINKLDPRTDAASVGRLLRPGGAEVLFWDQGFGPSAQTSEATLRHQD